MELVKGYIKEILVPVPATTTSPSVVINDRDGDVVAYSAPVEFDEERKVLKILLPYAAVEIERTVIIHVKFTVDNKEYDRKITAEVKTPYLELFELQKILGTNDEEECWTVERVARHIINAHCGQEFGYSEEPVTLIGQSERTLSLPRPVVRLDRLSEDGVEQYDQAVNQGNANWFLGKGEYIIVGEGWYIKRPSVGVETVKDHGDYFYSANPIRLPRYSNNEFINDVEYKIWGAFGYESVPEPVKEATKLLVNEYKCGDVVYRDKYLKGIKSGDWRLDYHDKAFVRTGNARVDALLNPYIVNRFLVI